MQLLPPSLSAQIWLTPTIYHISTEFWNIAGYRAGGLQPLTAEGHAKDSQAHFQQRQDLLCTEQLSSLLQPFAPQKF